MSNLALLIGIFGAFFCFTGAFRVPQKAGRIALISLGIAVLFVGVAYA